MTKLIPRYYDIFDSYDQIAANSSYGEEVPSESQIVYAGYTYEDYSGDALVVFVKDGKLYENNDGHCSCNGLESWAPEETSVAALKMRTGWPGLHEALEENQAALTELLKIH